jgi:hypothetical protein
MKGQARNPDTRRSMTPSDHAGQFPTLQWLYEAAQIRPVTFFGPEEALLVAKCPAHARQEVGAVDRARERAESIGDTRGAMREAKQVRLISQAQSIPGPTLLAALGEIEQVLPMPYRGR